MRTISVPRLLCICFIGLYFISCSRADYSYTEYTRLASTPSATDLMKQIIAKDPLIEMYQCGQRSQYADIEKELNELITSGKLSGCKKLK